MPPGRTARKDQQSPPPAGTEIGQGTRLGLAVDIRHGARIGRNCFIASNAVIGARARIGDNVTVGQAAIVGQGEGSETRVGSAATIGQGAIIQAGVAIGDGATIAPWLVISQDVPARAVARGDKTIPHRPGARELIRQLAWWEWAAFSFLLVFSALFYAVYQAPLFFDANVYYLGGVSIFLNGIFTRHDFSDLRTYGYPLFIAFGHHLSKWFLFSPRTAVVLLQILLYAGGVLSFRLAMARFRDQSLPARLVFVGLSLNVFVLIYLREVLTEAPSIGLIVVMVTLLYVSARTASGRVWFWSVMAGSLACGYLVMIRPGNLFMIPVWVVGQLLARDLRRRNGLPRPLGLTLSVLVLAAGVGFPMLLQVRNNYVYFGRATPLPVFDLGTGQQELGIRWLKMATLIPPSPAPQVRYYNPFSANIPGAHEPLRWYAANPGRGALTLAIHAFSLLDMDIPLPYTSNPLVWYRWPWGVFNHLFVAMAVAGAWFGWRRSRHAAAGFDLLPRYALLVLAVYVAGYCAIYIPVCSEVRFGFPLMLLVMPLALLGWAGLRGTTGRRLGAIAAAAAMYTIAALALSQWVRAQAPLLADLQKLRDGSLSSSPEAESLAPEGTPVFGQSGRGRIELPSARVLEKPTRASTEFGLVTSVLSEVPALTGRVGGRVLHGMPFLFAHATSYISYSLEPGKWNTFTFSMGLDDVGDHDQGSVVYIVRGDGKELYRSPVIRAMTSPVLASVPIAGVRKLELMVNNGGDTIASDEAYWIDPRLN